MLPHEWKSVWITLSALHADVAEHGDKATSFVFGLIFPFAIGAAISAFLLPSTLTDVPNDKETIVSAASGILAFTGILVGFLVTLILFTGRFSYPEDTMLEELQFYVDRTKYLLYSQSVTIFAAIITTALVFIWCILVAGEAENISLLVLGHTIGGFTSICLFRTLLLPLQIYEMHVSWMEAMLESRRKAIEKEYEPSNRIE